MFSRLTSSMQSTLNENRVLTRDGRVLLVEWHGRPVFREDRLDDFFGVGIDITERRRLESERAHLEARLLQAQKLEAVGQLAGGVAHDFNNILTAIMMQADLLQLNPQLAPDVQAGLTDLQAEARRAAALTRQLLLFSRREVMRLQVFELNSLVGNLLKMLRRLIGENIHLELSGPSGDLWLEADPGMIEQVVTNLLVNARDAMPAGGRVTIHTRPVMVGHDSASPNPDARAGRFACLAVSDTGCGMDAFTRERIFEPFFTTKDASRGTGLGLATVYGIVRQHQGWVDVDSEIGRGSTFSVYLPTREPGTEPMAVSEQASPLRGGRETVLLVEDEPSVRATEASMLRQLGYRVLEADSAQQALAVWDEVGHRVDLLVTDMVMPGGTTGWELADQLLARRPDLRAILVSGYSAEVARVGAPGSDRITFLAKPLTATQLGSAVRDALNTR